MRRPCRDEPLGLDPWRAPGRSGGLAGGGV